jgi:hypothetical protein
MRDYLSTIKPSNVLHRPAEQLGYKRQPEGDIYLPPLGRLVILMEGVVVIGDLIQRFGLGPQVLGMPNTALVAVLEQTGENLGGYRRPV